MSNISPTSNQSRTVSPSPHTRELVQSLVDYLARGHPLDEFFDDFPTVRREWAVELLEQIKEMLEDV